LTNSGSIVYTTTQSIGTGTAAAINGSASTNDQVSLVVFQVMQSNTTTDPGSDLAGYTQIATSSANPVAGLATMTTYTGATIVGRYYRVRVTASNNDAAQTVINFNYSMLCEPPPFTPTQISTLRAWFKGDVGLTTSSWTNQANDKLNIDTTDVTVFANMTLTTVNGLQAARFNAANGYGQFAVRMNAAGSPASRTMFCVMKTDSVLPSPGGNVNITSQYNGGYFGGYVLEGTSSGGYQHFLVTYGQALEINFTSPVSLTTNSQFLLGSSWDTTSSASTNNFMYKNSTAYTGAGITWTPDYGFYDYNSTVTTYLGTKAGICPASNATWILCEILMYGKALTQAEGAQVASYLKAKWNTP